MSLRKIIYAFLVVTNEAKYVAQQKLPTTTQILVSSQASDASYHEDPTPVLSPFHTHSNCAPLNDPESRNIIAQSKFPKT